MRLFYFSSIRYQRIHINNYVNRKLINRLPIMVNDDNGKSIIRALFTTTRSNREVAIAHGKLVETGFGIAYPVECRVR